MLIEFTLVAFLLVITLLSVIEFNRMLIVYSAVAECARAGVRYAIVHGNSRLIGCNNGVPTAACKCASAVDCPSGPGNTTQVETVVRNFAGTGLLDSTLLIAACPPAGKGICVNYLDGTDVPGSRVRVTVVYTYDPLANWFQQLQIPLSSTSEGVIAF